MMPRFLPAGETALVVEFGRTIDAAAEVGVLALDAALAAHPIDGIVETVPTYRSLMVHFDPRKVTGADLAKAIGALDTSGKQAGAHKNWHVPVCYDPPHSEDLAEAADLLGLTPERVVALHSETVYTLVMYGFAPGFVFLGGLPPELAVSRRQTPRPPAPAGALTIAGGQALIASVTMPTGWYMLGRTPARTFDPCREPMFPMGIGDTVRLQRIDANRFTALEAEAEAGRPVIIEGT